MTKDEFMQGIGIFQASMNIVLEKPVIRAWYDILKDYDATDFSYAVDFLKNNLERFTKGDNFAAMAKPLILENKKRRHSIAESRERQKSLPMTPEEQKNLVRLAMSVCKPMIKTENMPLVSMQDEKIIEVPYTGITF